MTVKQIEYTFKSAVSYLLSGKVKLALDKTEMLVAEMQWPETKESFEDISRNYRLMLQYFVQGAEDPQRQVVYRKLVSKLLKMVHKLHEELMMRNSTSYEYIQKRYFPHKLRFRSSSDLLDSLKYYHSQSEMLKDKDKTQHESELKRLRNNFEPLLPDIFALFWLHTGIDADLKACYSGILHPSYPGIAEKCIMVSALTLNVWRQFDDEKLMMLFDACDSANVQVKQRALVGICFILTKYNQYISFFPAIRNRLVLLSDEPSSSENIKNILLLIIGSADTEKITRKMREEILPEVMKLSPVIKNKLESDLPMSADDWNEENPEWQDIINESGVADKIQELNELQMEGADVYMSTFAMLKSFSFFNETANWFMPFDSEFLDVSSLFRTNDKSILTAFMTNNIICNSDKFSFCLSLLQMPASQRESIGRSFKSESSQMEEMLKDESLIKPGLSARNEARQYIQDLYRFFRLHPQHQDFSDMFKLCLDIHKSNFFDIISSDNELRSQVADYYFSKAHYQQAIELFHEMTTEANTSAATFQKLGFALQKESRIAEALEAYSKADIIQPDDHWTIKKMALCHRISGNIEKALENYRHADFLQPGNSRTIMQIANCLILTAKYKEALRVYANLEKSDPENRAIWKATSWCAFLSGNIHQADYYAEKLLGGKPDANDYMNNGHIAFALKKRDKALQFYLQSLNMLNHKIESWVDQMHNDIEVLMANGISKDDIMLMIDEVYFAQKNQP
jgi:tetratricopeptide (TPR) repeat protein